LLKETHRGCSAAGVIATTTGSGEHLSLSALGSTLEEWSI
jgi:hypothetical protein